MNHKQPRCRSEAGLGVWGGLGWLDALGGGELFSLTGRTGCCVGRRKVRGTASWAGFASWLTRPDAYISPCRISYPAKHAAHLCRSSPRCLTALPATISSG